jgi:hypothetical protein
MCGSGGIALPFLASALDRGECSASLLGRFISEEAIPDQVGPTIGLNIMGKRKILPLWRLEAWPCRPQSLAISTELLWLQCLKTWLMNHKAGVTIYLVSRNNSNFIPWQPVLSFQQRSTGPSWQSHAGCVYRTRERFQRCSKPTGRDPMCITVPVVLGASQAAVCKANGKERVAMFCI